jgi:hypothetical protein
MRYCTRNGGQSLTGKNAAGSVRTEDITGIVYKINEYIRTFKKEHNNTVIAITGRGSDLPGGMTVCGNKRYARTCNGWIKLYF